MSLTPTLVTPPCPRRARRSGLARWWLAGLLVGCLLPASLATADASRVSERSVAICLWVPAMLRAQSRRLASEQRSRRAAGRKKALGACLSRLLLAQFTGQPMVAARDVFTRRGPPRPLPLKYPRRFIQ
ncbi:hypothetical protein [Vreelandella malpeensis]|uniref:Uncharacterized protein n=1 Tax=Vreelandella malpeensis TaxID=1172368 RepID=A0ABS8DU13_9GAMM|nr:hypothetical protein [Halomonas malpeensis]MCB8889746.1 hypothetical protein [Halomonas malpeensis]